MSLALVAMSGLAADVQVDFGRKIGKVRPELHSSGYAPKSVSAGKTFEYVKSMHFHSVRTHDLALVNSGQRVVDTHFIFPLAHLDAADPSNYYFKATDRLLSLSRDAGLDVFYRLGTSIEHSGLVHFNAEIPTDFGKLAEVFAGTVRHYNRGWANGFHWGIKYWEIWNEPDGCNNMWSFNGEDDTAGHFANQPKRMRLFREFFVTCLKRLKSEFPDIRVGGPAFCSYNEEQIRPLLKDCKESGVAPDFLSWHCYTRDPDEIISAADKARRLCDSFGFTETELIINEWHYLFPGGWGAIRSSDPEVQERVQFSPDGQNGIDSACFTLSTLARLQTSKYDQSYFYGCMHEGNWGYLDAFKKPNKNYFACSAFGRIMSECTELCVVESQTNSPVVLAACDDASGRKLLLVVDYGGRFGSLNIDVRGVPEESSAAMFVLSHEKDLEKQEVHLSGSRLSLVKPIGASAAYLIQFEKQTKTPDLQDVCQRLVDEAVASGEQGGVQFCAYKDGKCIVDVWAGTLSTNAGAAKVDGRSLFPIFSTEKPLLATAVHRAVEKGLMDYDKPLCTWWPEFTGDGKEKLTLGLTLGYRSGMPAKLDPAVFPTVEDQCDWSRICKWAAAVKPELEPGTKQRYMSQSYGWYLGHPLEVAYGKPLKGCLDELVLAPAGIMDDFFFATNEGCESRIATFYGNASVERMNDRRRWRFCLPSAYAVANARSVARFYNRLCGFDGKEPLIRRETLDNALKPCRHPSDPLPDAQTMKNKWFMIFGMGYGLWGEAERMDRVFGHGGAGGSEGLVDRDNRLIVAYTCNFDNHKGGLRQRLYDAVGMKWRYWKDKDADIQTLQMQSSGRAAPFAMPELKDPPCPDRTFSVADYGAKPGGVICTEAFARAVSACEAAGGGHVVVPSGRWTVGPIHLTSNCDLHLSKDAVLEFTDDPADYLPPVKTTWEGVECMGYSPLIYAYAATNVSITGSGTLAPRMDMWRKWFARGPGARGAMEMLYGWCSTNAPIAARDVTAIPDNRMRPQLIQMNRSANVLLDGFRIRESPFWTIHLYMCENCIVRGIDSVAHGVNNDGIDIDMTRNVLVENCRFDQGDDGIVLKAGRNADGWRLNRPTENVVVTNCTFSFAHSLLGIGSELSGGIRNVWMSDCRIGHTYNMIYIKTNRRRGGFVENVWVDHVTCDGDVRSAVVAIDMGILYQWAVLPDYELRYTSIRNINLSHVTAKSADWAVDLKGDAHQPPEDIRIGDLHVDAFRSGEKRVENCRNVVVETR